MEVRKPIMPITTAMRTYTRVLWVVLSILVVAGCEGGRREPTTDVTSSDSASHEGAGGSAIEQPNDPIRDLLDLANFGIHCFATPADAVSAQLRASKAAERQNAEMDRASEGQLKPPPGSYLYVSDVGENGQGPLCYSVSTGALH